MVKDPDRDIFDSRNEGYMTPARSLKSKLSTRKVLAALPRMNVPGVNITLNSATMTSSNIIIADIVYQEDGPTKVHIERLLTSTEITGYAEVSSNNIISLSKRPVHSDAGIRKAYNKGFKATRRVQQFLTSTSANKSPQSALSATMNIGATSIVGGSPTGCHSRDGPASFEEVGFEFLGTQTRPTSSAMASFWTPQVPRSVTSTQYLHFACPTLKLEDAIVDRNGHSRYDSISITSGMCLFSNNIREACDLASGNLGLTPLSYRKPTIYEIEFIARAAPAIADLACAILARNEACGISSPLSINLDIPTWHYYKAIDSTLEQGLCTASDALLYLEAIEKRHDQISAVFETAIRYACAVRQANPVINTSPRVNSVSACIKSALTAGFRPCLEDVMQELHEEKGGVWRQFLKLVPIKEHPEDFQSLGLLFYVYQAMKTAFIPRIQDQMIEYDLGPSLQISTPEEMSICLPAMPASTAFSSELHKFDLNQSKFGPDWLDDDASSLIGEISDEDDNELSFDDSSTVDIRVLSSEAWASNAGTDSDFGDDMQLECVTVVEDVSYREVDSDIETLLCRSPRLIGQDVSHSRSNALHLPPTSDFFGSAACMADAQNGSGLTVLAEASDEHSNDAMLSTLKAASSFCIQASATCSEPSSDDELASHIFMLPSPVLSRSFWAPSLFLTQMDEALPILTDDETSHIAMLAPHNDFVAYHFNMDKGITERDGKALDDRASLAAMVSYGRAKATKQHAYEDIHRSERASKDECLSCAAMLPTSTAASNIIMTGAGWNMNNSGDESAAHAAMMQRLVMVRADHFQPGGIDEMDSCVAMMPTSEAASTAVMALATSKYPFRSEDDENTSHASMLATFKEPESLEMAKHMCMAAAMTPLDLHDNLNHVEAPMDEFAAHAAMMGTVDQREEEEEDHRTEETKQEFDDTVVSHLAMLSVDDAASSSGMIGSLGLGDAIATGLSTTMPMDDHASHSTMSCIANQESSAYMLSTLSPDDRDVVAEMETADFDVELASHAAMRGIVDLSSSFCMAETLTAVLKIKDNAADHVLMKPADNNVVILSNGEDEDASNIAMLYPVAEENASHAAMVSVAADHLADMDINEQASHLAMLPDSIASFFIGKPARLATTVEDTSESLASHAAMLPTSNDELASHQAMLPTSTDESESHEMMRPTSNDEAISHAAMMPAIRDDELMEMPLKPKELDSHATMLTSSICMAATLSEEHITTGRASSTRSSTSSADFSKLPKNKTTSLPIQPEKPRVLILSVDDRCKKRIYSQAQTLLKKLRDSQDADTDPILIEAYLMNRVFANGNAEGDILYFGDPSPKLPVGDDGLEMEPGELVRKLYGEEAASNLNKWFKDVGLGV